MNKDGARRRVRAYKQQKPHSPVQIKSPMSGGDVNKGTQVSNVGLPESPNLHEKEVRGEHRSSKQTKKHEKRRSLGTEEVKRKKQHRQGSIATAQNEKDGGGHTHKELGGSPVARRRRVHDRKHGVVLTDDEVKKNIKRLAPIYRRKIFLDQLRRMWWLVAGISVLLVGISVAVSIFLIPSSERLVNVTSLPLPIQGRWGIVRLEGMDVSNIVEGVRIKNDTIIRSVEQTIKDVYLDAGTPVEKVELLAFNSSSVVQDKSLVTNKDTLVLEHIAFLERNSSIDSKESELKALIQSIRNVLMKNDRLVFDPNLLTVRRGTVTSKANSVSSFLQSDFPSFDLERRTGRVISSTHTNACQPIPKLQNGKIYPEDCHNAFKIRTGLSCITQCAGSALLTGSRIRTCLSGGTWSGWMSWCEPPCQPLTHPSNGKISPKFCVTEGDEREKSPILSGENCYYFCNPGYKLLGTVRSSCKKNGRWSTVPSICKKTCTGLSPPENGHIVPKRCTNLWVPEETFCTYYCDDGYVVRGEVTASCLGDGTWTSEVPHCSKTCDKLPQVVNAIVHPSVCWSGKVDAGIRCIFECEKGYEMAGTRERMCDPEYGWTESNPSCLKMCPKLHQKSNLLLPHKCVSQSSTPGTQCIVSCENGFQVVGKKKLVCQQDGSWNTVVPTCSAVCRTLPQPEVGHIICSGQTTDSTCSLFCPDHHFLFGAQSVTCGKYGSWSDRIGYCMNTCSKLNPPEHGMIVPSKCGYEVAISGQVCQFECENGYSTSGPNEAICQDNGEWNQNVTTCKKENQYMIEAATAGHKICLKHELDKLYVTKEEWEDCMPGVKYTKWTLMTNHLIRNVDSRKCLAVQSSSSLSFLIAVTCDAGDPMQAWDWPISGNGSYWLKLKNRDVYAWEGYKSLLRIPAMEGTANVKSNWYVYDISKKARLSLYGVYNDGKCPPLTNGPKGRWSPSACSTTGVHSLAYCSYVCSTGFSLLTNDAETQCINGIWTKILEPQCGMSCSGLKIPYGSSLSVEPSECEDRYVTEKTICVSKCPNNTILVGERYTICLRGGTWSFSLPFCLALCPPLPTIRNGVIVKSGNCSDHAGMHIDGSSCEVQCNEGYVLSGGPVRRCNGGTWNNETPRCVRKCDGPEFRGNGLSTCSESVSYIEGETCMFSCNAGYALSGNDTITCLASGRWKPNIPVCRRLCSDLTTTPNLVVNPEKCRDASAVMDGTICHLSCNPGHDYVGVSSATTCLSTGQWSEPPGSCHQSSHFFIRNILGTEIFCLTTQLYSFQNVFQVDLKPYAYCHESNLTDLWVMGSDGKIRNVGTGWCLGMEKVEGYALVKMYKCSDPQSENWRCLLKYGRYVMADQSGSFLWHHDVAVNGLEVSMRFEKDWNARDAFEWKGVDINGNIGSICGIALNQCPELLLVPETSFTPADFVRCQLPVNVSEQCMVRCSHGPQIGMSDPGAPFNCTDYGLWSPDYFDCPFKSCPPLVLNPHSSVDDEYCTNSSSETDGSRNCSFKCKAGLTRVSENPYIDITVCLPSGEWSEAVPFCLYVCAKTRPFFGSKRSEKCENELKYYQGYICQHECRYDQYLGIGETSVTKCLDGGRHSFGLWDVAPPICSDYTNSPPVPCTALNVDLNGDIKPSNCTSVPAAHGQECSIDCNANYLPDRTGSISVKCQKNGEWYGTLAKCIRRCDVFDYLSESNRKKYGHLLYMKPERCSIGDNREGDICYVDCNSNRTVTKSQFYQRSSPAITCLNTGLWNATDADDFVCVNTSTVKIRSLSNGLCVRAESLDLVIYDSCDQNDWPMWWIVTKSVIVSKARIGFCLFVNLNSTLSPLSLKQCNVYDERQKFDCGFGDRKLEILFYYTNRKLTHVNGSNRVFTTLMRNWDQSPTPPSLFVPNEEVPEINLKSSICTVSANQDSCSVFEISEIEDLSSNCTYEPVTHTRFYDRVYDGRTCTLTCAAEHHLTGDGFSQCFMGNWSRSLPQCLRKCPPMILPEYVTVTPKNCSSESHFAGTFCQLACKEGFVSVKTSRTCRATGEWSGEGINCYKSCSPIKEVLGGEIKPRECTIAAQLPSTVCSTICSEGYEIDGTESQVCQPSGNWSNPQGQCVILCPKLTPIVNGEVSLECTQQRKKSGEVCLYTCDAGYTLLGTGMRECRLSGLWSGSPPQCLSNCPALTAPDNGALSMENALVNVQGAVVKVTCKLDFAVDSYPFRECLSSGFWSGETVRCVRESQFVLIQKSSPSPPFCIYADRTFSVLVRPSVECEQTPYYLWAWKNGKTLRNVGANRCLTMSSSSPEKYLVLGDCDSTQKWICSIRDKRNLLTLEESKLIPVYSSLYPTKVLLLEEEMIQFLNDAGIAAISHLQWIAKTSEKNESSLCVTETTKACPHLKLSDHLQVSPVDCTRTTVVVGVECVFSCEDGFIMRHRIDSTTCLNSGFWTVEPPECVPSCQKLPFDTSVIVSPEKCSTFNLFREGEICQFRCKREEILVGESLVICMKNGQWSSAAPQCKRTCSPLKIPIQGKALPEICSNLTHRAVQDTECTLSCLQEEHILTGSKTRSCTNLGTWSGYVSECVKPCNELIKPSDAIVSPLNCVSTKSPIGTTCSFQCKDGFFPSETHYRTCLQNGTWNETSPVCQKYCAEMNATNRNGVIYPLSCTYEKSKPGTVCEMKCNSGFDVIGSRTAVCSSTGRWNKGLGTCTRRCALLRKPLHGALRPAVCLGQDMFAGMICSSTCRRGFLLEGSTVRTCTESGVWTGKEPRCKRSCSPIGLIAGAKVDPKSCSDSRQVLGGTCIITCNENMVLGNWETHATLTCLAGGFWDRPIPSKCLRKCEIPTVENGDVYCNGKTLPGEALEGQKCYIKCASYHVATLHPVSVCTEGSWNPLVTSCAYDPYPLLMVQRVDLNAACLGINGSSVVMHPWKTCRNEGAGTMWSWKSRYSIVNLISGLCLTAISDAVDEPLIVSACNESDPLQHWDCDFEEPYRIFLNNSMLGPGLRYFGANEVTLQQGVGANSLFYTFSPNSDDELGTLCSMRPEKGCLRLPLHAELSVSPERCSYNTVSRGTTCFLSCASENRTLVGSPEIQCTGSGLWSPEKLGQCVPNCSPLPPLSENIYYDEVRCSNSLSNPGDFCTFACSSGYLLKSQFRGRKCTELGVWTDAGTVKCHRECPALTSPANAMLIPSVCTHGACSIECNAGYRLDGPRIRVCQEFGEWSGNDFSCIEDIQFSISTNLHVFQARLCLTVTNRYTVVKQLCELDKKTQLWRWKSQYALENVASETCLAQRTEGAENPLVGRKLEDSEEKMGIALTNFRNSSEKSDVFVINCNASDPTQRWDCETHFPKNRFRVVLLQSRLYLDSGPQYTGRITLTSKPFRSSRWAVSDHEGIATLCSRRSTGICSALPPLYGGVITPSVCQSQFITVGTTCNFKCTGDFVIEGSRTSVCRKDGFWTNNPASCLGIQRCPSLDVKSPLISQPPSCKGTRVPVGRSCMFHCPDTHTLFGKETMLCVTSKAWPDVLPTCDFYCPGLPPPVYGLVLPESCQNLENEVGKTCVFSCSNGYDIIGSPERRCGKDGVWTGRKTFCRKLCPMLKTPLHASIAPQSCLSNKSGNGAVCSVKCDEGYVLLGSATTACDHGTWSQSLPSCSGDACPRLSMEEGVETITYTKLVNNAIVPGSMFQFTCMKEFRATEHQEIFCGNDGSWIRPEELCISVSCKPLQRLYHGLIEPTRCTGPLPVKIGVFCSFSCDDGFILSGSPSTECLPLGKWSTEVIPECHDTYTYAHSIHVLIFATPFDGEGSGDTTTEMERCIVAQDGDSKSVYMEQCYPVSPFKLWRWYGSSRIQNVGNHLCWEVNSDLKLLLEKCDLNQTHQEVSCGDISSKFSSLQVFANEKMLAHDLTVVPKITAGNLWIAFETPYVQENITDDPNLFFSVMHSRGSPLCTFMCGGLLVSDEGDISTPNFPRKYPPDVTCKWTISAPQRVLFVDFSAIKLSTTWETSEGQCSADYIQVFGSDNGDTMKSDVIAKICGSRKDFRVKTLHGSLHIELHSDHVGNDNQHGFSAKWFSEDLPSVQPSCGVSNALSSLDLENDTSILYPWQVAITTWKKLCDGAFIGKRFVLTSAHCIEHVLTAHEIAQISVAWKVTTQTNFLSKLKRKEWDRADRLWVHSEYNKEIMLNNIAILRLRRGMRNVEDFTHPICMTSYENGRVESPGYHCAMSSFSKGLVKNLSQKWRFTLLAQAVILSEKTCERLLLYERGVTFDKDSFLCAELFFQRSSPSPIMEERDEVSNDGGAMLQCLWNENWYAVGIFNFPLSDISDGVFYVFTKVLFHDSWIRNTVANGFLFPSNIFK